MSVTYARSALAALLLLPASAGAEPQVGDRFGDWSFECTAQSATRIDCGLAQLVVIAESREPIARFRITGPAEPAAEDAAATPGQLSVLLPLGLDLQAGVTASTDTGTTLPLSVATCVQQGCLLTAPVTDEIVAALREGAQMNVGFALYGNGQSLEIAGSLAGLDAAFTETGWY
ncbi:hypothetical protein OG2516_13631 [Oceanicola granulosus HTCC2516]|uniref:Invasion associated family protein n=1 Tax=Oceanicola granulosus (strain ATCC BAA-861 / DSM 15982 / KCTC 12143 / HTCC2516) TaxID=314256 RepID=Q2CE21_OCEGH|nr:invasion associated locus B family protein [Oceanicola granulosus]EAR50917.1 hypothetical protein OG2516_13631 [Oceanicola granulosus HTCC2516]